jgi:ABC-2 type transport system permease protein
MNSTAIYGLMLKDLKVFIRDRKALLLSLIAPVVIGGFFGFIFNGDTKTPSKIALIVVDRDQSTLTHQIAEDLSQDPALKVIHAELEAAKQEVRTGRVCAAIVLPRDFGATAVRALVGGGAKQELLLYSDPSKSMETAIVQGLLAQYVMQDCSREAFSGATGRRTIEQSIQSVDTAAGLQPELRKSLMSIYTGLQGLNRDVGSTDGQTRSILSRPYELKEEKLTARTGVQYNGYAHSMAGMGIQFILFMGVETGIALLLIRRSGIWARLRSAPLALHDLFASRLLSATLIATLNLLAIFVLARLIFNVHIQGSLPGFVMIVVAFSAFTGAYGILIASLGRTPEASRGISIMLTLFLVMLSGAWVPSFIFPGWLKKITLVFPTRWAMDGLDAMTWRGLGFQSAILPTVVLLAFTALMLCVAGWRFPFNEKA